MKTTSIIAATTSLLLLATSCASAPVTPGEARAGDGRGARTSRPSATPEEAEARGRLGLASDAESAADALPARARRLFDEALKALEDQKSLKVPVDWALMEKKWRAVTGAGEVAEAHFNLGVALENQGKEADAKAEYERALALKPSLRHARVNLAVVGERKGDPRAASATYGEILGDFPEDAMARARLAALYQASGQQEDAWRLAREALLRDPKAIGAYKTMIRVALQRKESDVAKLIALRAQKLDERDVDVAFLLGEVLELQGDEPAAAAQWARTLELAPGHLPARYALLRGALKKEAWPRVEAEASAILKEQPSNAAVTLLRGIALRHTEKVDEALEAYEKAEKLSGGSLAEVYLARGVLLMRDRSECEPALVQFERYTKSAGPILPKGSPVPTLQRECDELIAANKAAAEAARQMALEAERQAAEAARQAAEEQRAAEEKKKGEEEKKGDESKAGGK